jgi:nicotinamidase/pyrazinamidase
MTVPFIAPDYVASLDIDPQTTFCSTGKLPVRDGEAVIPVINRLRTEFKTRMRVISKDAHPLGHSSFASTHGRQPFERVWLKDGKIVAEYEKDVPGPEGAILQTLWTDHGMDGTVDGDFHPDLVIDESDRIIKKGTNPLIDSYSAFYENDGQSRPVFANGKTLTETFKEAGITTIVITGLAYDFCVGFSALDAVKDGFNVIIVKDATRSIAMPSEINEGCTTEDDMTVRLLAAGVRIVNSDELPQLRF